MRRFSARGKDGRGLPFLSNSLPQAEFPSGGLQVRRTSFGSHYGTIVYVPKTSLLARNSQNISEHSLPLTNGMNHGDSNSPVFRTNSPPTKFCEMPYRPQPLDIAHVEIPLELDSLLEKLAVNVHDIWADQRLKDGWKFGPERDDAKKEHPCLRPFNELPVAEQEYDRRVVRDTLRAVLTLGYRIEK